MKTPVAVAALAGLATLAAPELPAAPHTPKPGSPERKAICDAMRAHVARDAKEPLPKPIVFKVEFLRVDGGYAGFEGYPVFEDGSEVIGVYLPDVVSTALLERGPGGAWRVIFDLSRSDVPSENELAGIRRSLPADVPGSVLPEFWRKALKR